MIHCIPRFKVIVTVTDRSAAYDFLLTFHRNHGPRTVSEIDREFSRKSRNFPTSGVFNAPLKRFPLELDIGAWGQNTGMMGLYRSEKEV